MAEEDSPPQKAVADPETYREALNGWMTGQLSSADGVRVHDVDMPRATGLASLSPTTALLKQNLRCCASAPNKTPMISAKTKEVCIGVIISKPNCSNIKIAPVNCNN